MSYKSVNDSQNAFLRSLIQTVVSIMVFESLEDAVCYRGLKKHGASQKRSVARSLIGTPDSVLAQKFLFKYLENFHKLTYYIQKCIQINQRRIVVLLNIL